MPVDMEDLVYEKRQSWTMSYVYAVW
jgi:hypothetical protein